MNFLATLRRLAAIVFCLGAGLAVAHAETANLPHAKVGDAYTYTIATTPAAPAGTVYGATGLPSGISINSSSGQISGTPSTAGTYTGVISLTLNSVANNLNYSLVVDPADNVPVIGSATSASATVGQSFDYLVEADADPTSFNIGTLPAGLSFDSGTNRIAGNPTSAGTYAVSLSANNEHGTGATATLTITVSPAGPVPVISSAATVSGTLVPASDPTRYEVSYEIEASNDPASFAATGLPVGVSLNSTTGLISGETTVQGIYSVTLTATNNNGTGPAATLNLTVGSVSSITSAGPFNLTVGQAANITLTASNDALSFNIGALPPGLSGNGATGVISGTPTAAGTANVTVSGNNAVGAGPSATITITVAAAPVPGGGGGGGGGTPAPAITSVGTANAIAGDAFTFTVTASNNPTSFAATGLPEGLSINTSTGVISGTTLLTGERTVTVSATGSGGTGFAQLVINVRSRPTFTLQPQSASVAIGGNVTLTASGTGVPVPTYQWHKNGIAISGAVGATFVLSDISPADAAAYTVTLTNVVGARASTAAVVGLTSTAKAAGQATVVQDDIEHPNGNIYDQVLLTGSAAAITADANQVTRMSFVDLNDDIVQVELSGPGTLTLTLENATGPAVAAKYNQPTVSYMKGHASLVISGATVNTHVTIFTVGTQTALNPTLFKSGETYDGIADVGLLSITSADGKFGGIRSGNAHYFSASGLTGVHAPGVAVQGPMYVGEITASDAATPVLMFASVTDLRITGGELAQLNERAVEVDGIARANFTAGSKSNGDTVPAGTNQARFERNGVDVTTDVAPLN